MSEKKATSVLEIDLPHTMVELQDLKTLSGAPVVVRCERPDAIEMFRVSQMLPGAMITNGEPVRPDLISAEERIELVRNYAPPLIMAGTALEGAEGVLIRPAFTWSGHPHSIPGSALSARDLMLLADTVASLAGYGSTSQSEVAFRDGDGEGGGGSPGAGPAGDEVRTDPVGSNP